MASLPLLERGQRRRSKRMVMVLAAGVTCSVLLLVAAGANVAGSRQEMLGVMPAPFFSLYGGHHWGGVGSEGYGTAEWDNTGWNEHYHPRDGASMDSESMEPYTWRKGPRVNDEYTFDDGGDPTVDPGKSWEPPIMVNGNPVYKGTFHSLKGLKGAFQSLAAVDLGEESNAEVLMDPSHPSGEWGTWVEPSTSALSVLGEKQYDAYIATLSDKSNAEMANLKNSDEAKGLKQSLAQVAKARTPELYQESFEQGMKAQEMYDKPRNSLVHVDEAGHVDIENFGSNVREHFLPNAMRPGGDSGKKVTSQYKEY